MIVDRNSNNTSRRNRSKRKQLFRTIHVTVRPLSNYHKRRGIQETQTTPISASDRTRYSVRTTSNHTSNHRWANSTDYRLKQLNNPNKKKDKNFKKKCKLRILIGILIIVILLLAILLPLLLRPTNRYLSIVRNQNVTLRWNMTGIIIAGTNGTSGNGSNELYAPWGLALTYENTLYIADRYNNRIQKYRRNDLYGTTIAGQANSTGCEGLQCLRGPTFIVLDNTEDMYIADASNHRIVFWRNGVSTGQLVAGAGNGNAINQFSHPYNIARDAQTGTLYVSDCLNHRIMRYNSSSNTGVVVAGGNGAGNNSNQLSLPMGVYFESSSNSLLIANQGSNNIVRWRLGESNWTLIAGNINGSMGNTPTSFRYPYAFTFDPMGNLYVADTYNHRIQFFFSGQTEGKTIAGVANTIGSSSNLFNGASSVLLDNQLNMIVTDTWNNRVQKFLRY